MSERDIKPTVSLRAGIQCDMEPESDDVATRLRRYADLLVAHAHDVPDPSVIRRALLNSATYLRDGAEECAPRSGDYPKADHG